MAHPVLDVLSHQEELSAAARRRLGDANEAGLVVNKVISRALNKVRSEFSTPISAAQLMRELDAMIAEAGGGRAQRPS